MIPDDSQTLFADTLRSFARERLTPSYRRREHEPLPDGFVADLGQLGVLGLREPEEHGGTDADPVSVGIASEELFTRRLQRESVRPAERDRGNRTQIVRDTTRPSAR
jgi:alkylation response protein AidB-like acyl-CoA dehydrogenase